MIVRKLLVAATIFAVSAGVAPSAEAAHYQKRGWHGPGYYAGPGRHHGWYRYRGGWRQHCAYRGPRHHRVWRCW